MRIASHTTWIVRQPEEVFDFFVDFDHAPRWRSYVTSMRRLDDGPIAPGSRVAVAMDVMGSRYEFELHVLVCERPSLWRHRTNEQHYRTTAAFASAGCAAGATDNTTASTSDSSSV